ncbi:MAG: 4-carboxy-4-hydroxy-2-oxoadipate aldolase/oxaloacetate decarboxylase [Clostridia bacterium]
MYDVIKNYKRASKELVEAFSKVGETASIHECMDKTGAMDSNIRPVWPGSKVCGTALTVHCRPGDNLMLHKAISMAQPGDVLVVSMDGFSETGGMWGGIMTASAIKMGVAGLVTDGACRDTMLIKELNFPIFTKEINVKGTTKILPGKINHPVMVGGVMVNPGDIVVGDNDSVVVIPKEKAEEVLKATLAREENEDAILKTIMDGKGIIFNIGGFDKAYEKLGLSEEE